MSEETLNIRLKDFPAKTNPIGSDLLYLANSADLNRESKSTLAQIAPAIEEEIMPGGILSPDKGGTGIDNSVHTITLRGNLSLQTPLPEDIFDLTVRVSGNTIFTIPPGNISPIITNQTDAVLQNTIITGSTPIRLGPNFVSAININCDGTSVSGPINYTIPDIEDDGKFVIANSSDGQVNEESFGANTTQTTITVNGITMPTKFNGSINDDFCASAIRSYTNFYYQYPVLSIIRGRGDESSPVPVVVNDICGEIQFGGINLSGSISSNAKISTIVDDNATTTAVPLTLSFEVNNPDTSISNKIEQRSTGEIMLSSTGGSQRKLTATFQDEINLVTDSLKVGNDLFVDVTTKQVLANTYSANTLGNNVTVDGITIPTLFQGSKDGDYCGAALKTYSGVGNDTPVLVFVRGKGTEASPLPVSANDGCGEISFTGTTTSGALNRGATIVAIVEPVGPSATAVPMALVYDVTNQDTGISSRIIQSSTGSMNLSATGGGNRKLTADFADEVNLITTSFKVNGETVPIYSSPNNRTGIGVGAVVSNDNEIVLGNSSVTSVVTNSSTCTLGSDQSPFDALVLGSGASSTVRFRHGGWQTYDAFVTVPELFNDGLFVIENPNEITLTSSVQVVPWETYYTNTTPQVEYTLPPTSRVGYRFKIRGSVNGTSGWKILQNAGQSIHVGASTTTVGVLGSVTSTNQYDCIELECIVEDLVWTVTSLIGTPLVS